MNTFLNFTFIGDPAYDFFFSIGASLNILFYLSSFALTLFRGR